MRTPRLVLASALCTLLASLAASAADGAGNYAIWGAGGRSCNQFERSSDDSAARARYRDYLMGYLTAYNTLAAETYNAVGTMTLDDAVRWLDDYCDAHRMDSFDRAVAQLVMSQHESRQRGSGSGGAAAGWGRARPPAAQSP